MFSQGVPPASASTLQVINEASNVHGHGYVDIGFVIPEAVLSLAASKGSFNLRQGDFATAGGHPAENIAKWDGSNWSAVGAGFDDAVSALTVFDSPSAVVSCSRRRVSTVALQPLYLLNSEFMSKAAQSLADRVRRQTKNEEQWVETAIRLTLQRAADAEEAARAKQLIEEHSLESLCLALLNLSEFIYIP